MVSSRVGAFACVAVFTALACGKSGDSPPSATPGSGDVGPPSAQSNPAKAAPDASGGSSAGVGPAAYTYCKDVCAKLKSCKDISSGDVGCVAACQNGLNSDDQRAQAAHFQCVLNKGKSCADYVSCFDDSSAMPDMNFYQFTDDQLNSACAKYCTIVSGKCKERFEQSDDCVGDCKDSSHSSSTMIEWGIDLLCTSVSQSCDEAVACNSVLDTISNRPSPRAQAPSGPPAPSRAACSNMGDSCVSDSDCCGSSARVRCWSSHCKAR
jgi:hypothetical protein